MHPVIPILVSFAMGLFFIIFGYRRLKKARRVIQDGISVEGIVFDFASSSDIVNTSDYDVYPIIRFVTKEGSWITRTYDIAISQDQIKRGQKMRIVYNPKNPEDFVIDSGIFYWINYVFLVSGFLPLIFGVYQLIQWLYEPA